MALLAEVGATPVVSQLAGAVVVHAHVAGWQPELEQRGRIPWCRRWARAQARARHNGAPGYHDAWAEASIRQLATWKMCRDCRHALVRSVETGTTPQNS